MKCSKCGHEFSEEEEERMEEELEESMVSGSTYGRDDILCDNCATMGTGYMSHLSKAQFNRILEVAIEARIEACLEDRDYLRNTVRDLAVRDDIISLLESISSGTKERIALLGFDPGYWI